MLASCSFVLPPTRTIYVTYPQWVTLHGFPGRVRDRRRSSDCTEASDRIGLEMAPHKSYVRIKRKFPSNGDGAEAKSGDSFLEEEEDKFGVRERTTSEVNNPYVQSVWVKGVCCVGVHVICCVKIHLLLTTSSPLSPCAFFVSP